MSAASPARGARPGTSTDETLVLVRASAYAADVLDAIVGDAICYIDAADFDSFLDEFGTDAEDPKAVRAARKVWQALDRQAPKVTAFLGDDFDAVAFDTERL